VGLSGDDVTGDRKSISGSALISSALPSSRADGKSLISRPQSRISLLVVPTDEELMIAQHTLALLPKGSVRKVAGERVAASEVPKVHPY
jgi:hypothetical protein